MLKRSSFHLRERDHHGSVVRGNREGKTVNFESGNEMEVFDFSDPSIILCWVCVTFESSDGFAHCSHCGAVDGLRLDSSLGN